MKNPANNVNKRMYKQILLTYPASGRPVNVGHVGVARWGQRSSDDDDDVQHQ